MNLEMIIDIKQRLLPPEVQPDADLPLLSGSRQNQVLRKALFIGFCFRDVLFFFSYGFISENHPLASYPHIELSLIIQDSESPLLRSLDCPLRQHLITFTDRKFLTV